jgi:hypothetical protein
MNLNYVNQAYAEITSTLTRAIVAALVGLALLIAGIAVFTM